MKKENQLLNRIGKAIGLVKAEDQAQDQIVDSVVEQAVEASNEEVVDTLTVALEVDAEPVQTALAELTAKFEELTNKFAELSAQHEEAVAALAKAEAEKAETIAAQVAAKAAARKQLVEAAIGTEKAAGLLAATENLDDAGFEAVVSALTGSVEAEAKTAMFTEVGQSGEVNASAVVAAAEESTTMKLLKAKFGDQK